MTTKKVVLFSEWNGVRLTAEKRRAVRLEFVKIFEPQKLANQAEKIEVWMEIFDHYYNDVLPKDVLKEVERVYKNSHDGKSVRETYISSPPYDIGVTIPLTKAEIGETNKKFHTIYCKINNDTFRPKFDGWGMPRVLTLRGNLARRMIKVDRAQSDLDERMMELTRGVVTLLDSSRNVGVLLRKDPDMLSFVPAYWHEWAKHKTQPQEVAPINVREFHKQIDQILNKNKKLKAEVESESEKKVA